MMDYVEGLKPLNKYVGNQNSPFFKNPVRSLSAYITILGALVECEQKGIVHRDLSLGNVLIGDDCNKPVIIDFGCCFLDNGVTKTLVDEAVGTPLYRAPECEGQITDPVSARSDLYSAAKLLWSMTTNRKAVAGEKRYFNDLSFSFVLSDTPMSWHLEDVLVKTIRNEPGKRYPSAKAAISDAQQVMNRILAGFQPLEALATNCYCPMCGRVGSLIKGYEFSSGTLRCADENEWDRPNPDSLAIGLSRIHASEFAHVCKYCGFISLVADRLILQRLACCSSTII